MKPKFQKRIYTFGKLVGDTGFLVYHMPQVMGLLRDENINRAFIEKIMTVVTAVNGCTYCAWFHARQAVKSGLSEAEVRNLLNLQFQADASSFELFALCYAQHYAETNRNPDGEMTGQLFARYGDRTARHILLIIRMIFFGNLMGNTFDAFLSRLAGEPAPNSSTLFEMAVFALAAPVLLPARRWSRE